MNKTYDYLASAKPIISVVGASTEITEEASCGIASEPDNPEDLANAVIRIESMSEEARDILGINGREYVGKYHDYKVLTTQLQLVVNESIKLHEDAVMIRERRIMIVGSFDLSLVLFRKELIETWMQKGYKVIAAAPGFAVKEQLEAVGVRYHNIPIERTGLNPARDLLVLFRLWRLFRLEKPGYLFFYTIKPVVYGSLAAALYKKASVFSMITGLGYVFMEEADTESVGGKRLGDIATPERSNGPKYPLFKIFRLRFLKKLVVWLYRIALSRNKKVFFQNPDDIDAFIRLHIVRPELVVRTNGSGVNLEHFNQQVVTALEEDNNLITFLLIARLLVEKGIREYVDAARAIKSKYTHTRFMLVGWSFEDNPSAISAKQVEVWREEGLVEIFGETQDVRPYIASSSVYVLPSYREGTPRTVLEAMAMGRPIITTDVPGCRETVVEGENGFLVKVKDKVTLIEAMEKFIIEPKLIKKMGAASRKIAEEKYDVHKVNKVINKAMELEGEESNRVCKVV
jgi:glycosyltransferase involved in cell wall biosynthesis